MAGTDTVSDPLPTSLSLLSRLRDADNSSGWQHFVEIYGALMHRVAVRAGLREDEARDVVQEAMIDVARQMPTFQYDGKRGSFKGWLYIIVRRRLIDYWRKMDRRPSTDDLEPKVDDAWTQEWEQHALSLALEQVRKDVPAIQFQAFDLHVLKGRPVAEVSRRLGVSSAAVYWAKYSISRRLRKLISKIERG